MRPAKDVTLEAGTAAAIVLGRPLTLPCGLVLPNRLAKAATSECLAGPDGQPTPALVTLYQRLSRGGAGLLITGNVMVRPDGIGEPDNVIMRPQSPLAPFAAWARAATSGGHPAFMQLNHAGRQSPRALNRHPVAPSAVPLRTLRLFAAPRALTTDDIEALIEAFAAAARRAVESGFSGVQLHAAHGYLLNQFLSLLSNRRTDRYGGSLENRMRMLIESYRRVRARVGPTIPVSVKLNSADFLRGGFGVDESPIVARTLAEEGVDLLEVSGGTYERPEMFIPSRSTTAREAHFLEFAREIRKVASCPLMLTGGLRTPRVMADLIRDGSIDLVGLARPLCLEPDLPREILSGRLQGARRPLHLTRWQFLAAAADGAWYQQQLHRMSRGQEPLAALSTLGALYRTFRGFLRRPPRSR